MHSCIHNSVWCTYQSAQIRSSYGLTTHRNNNIYNIIPLLSCSTVVPILHPHPHPPHVQDTSLCSYAILNFLLTLKLGWKQLFAPSRRVQEQFGTEISASKTTPANDITVVLFYLCKSFRLLFSSRKSAFILCTYPLRSTGVLFQTSTVCKGCAQCFVC